MTPPRVAIIGGGITGLAAAWELQKHGVDYTLFEASDRLGGKIVTEHIDGFTIEGGPDSFLSSKPWAWQLCDELGLRDRMIGTNDAQRNVFVLKGGKLHPFPKGMRLIVPVDESGLLASELISDEGKRRMLAEIDMPPYDAPADESMASFVRRHFGEEALDVFAEPLLAGIYSGDPDTMSIRATFPQFVEMERTHGSLIRAMREAPPAVPDPRAPKTAFFSLKGGTQELVDTLASKLTGEVRLKTSLYSISKRHFSYIDQEYRILGNSFLAAIDTTEPSLYRIFINKQPEYPPYAGGDADSRLYQPVQPELRDLYQLEWYGLSKLPSATISLGYRAENVPFPLNGFGFVITRSEPTELQAVTWTSTKLSNRAPNGYVLIRGFFSMRNGVHWKPARAAIGLFRQELKRLLGIEHLPTTRSVHYWNNPQYLVGYHERLARVEALMPPGFYMAGSSYRGVGVPDCIHQGQIAAHKAIDYLNHPDREPE